MYVVCMENMINFGYYWPWNLNVQKLAISFLPNIVSFMKMCDHMFQILYKKSEM